MTRTEWNEYVARVCGEPVTDATPKPVGLLLPLVWNGSDPHARLNEFEDERESAQLSDRHGGIR